MSAIFQHNTANKDKNLKIINIETFLSFLLMMKHKFTGKEKGRQHYSQQSTFRFSLQCHWCCSKACRRRKWTSAISHNIQFFPQVLPMLQHKTTNDNNDFTTINIQFFPPMLLMMQRKPTDEKWTIMIWQQSTLSFPLLLCQHLQHMTEKKDHNN